MRSVCFFNSAMTWGGGEKWHYEAALFFRENGYKVTVITSPGSALQQRLPDTVRCIPIEVTNLSFLNPLKIRRLKKIFAAEEVTTVVINLSSDLKLAGAAAKLAKVRRIIYRRGSAIPVRNTLLNRYYFGRILTDILANSEATKATILQNNPRLFPADKIKVIHNFIDIPRFTGRKYKPVCTKKDDEIVIGNIGRLVPQKNQRFLVDVAARLKAEKLPFKLLIGGAGPLEKELKEYAAQKGVSDHILFTGFLENVKDLLMSCDIFALSSLWEGFGYVLAEASLCRKPVVAFNISSNPELVIDGKTGFLTAVNDLADFCSKIIVLRNDPALRSACGRNGFDYIREHFAAGEIKKQLLAYLSE